MILSDIYTPSTTRHLTEVLKILFKHFFMGFSKQFNECTSILGKFHFNSGGIRILDHLD